VAIDVPAIPTTVDAPFEHDDGDDEDADHTYRPPPANTSGFNHGTDEPPRDEKSATQSYAYASVGKDGVDPAAISSARKPFIAAPTANAFLASAGDKIDDGPRPPEFPAANTPTNSRFCHENKSTRRSSSEYVQSAMPHDPE
jgi:hypothetical protein